MDIRLEWRDAKELQANPHNWRKHPPAQVKAMQDVFNEVGWAGALLYNERTGHLIDGHLRQKISKGRVPVLVGDWSEEDERKILLTLDPLAYMAEHDQDVLLNLLQSTEFQSDAINAMLEAVVNGETQPLPNLHEPKDDPGAQIDRAEELRQKWGTERGQVWEIGRHRLMCGDAGSEADHAKLLNGASVDLVLSDPPYGVGIEYASYDDSEDNLYALIDAFMPLVMKWPCVLLTTGKSHLYAYPPADWMLGWFEPAGVGRGPWGFTCWQPVLVYGKDPYLAHGMGSRPDGLVGKGEGASSQDHPVAKPLKVWSWLMERGTIAQGAIVLDPFLGSGTTIAVAEQLNRICYGMEISEQYCGVTLERMAGMGLEPRLV